jgi:hypothetical protein
LSIDNNINLFELQLHLDIYETFTATLLLLIWLVQGACFGSLSLIISNIIDTLLSGFLLTFTLYFYLLRLLYLTFWVVLIYSLLKNSLFLSVISLLESIQIFFKALTLPNRLSVNLFSGSLLGNIFIAPIFDHSLTILVYYCLFVVGILELNNAGLHLFIFLLLSRN